MKTRYAVALAILVGVPPFIIRSGVLSPPVELATLLYGLAIVGASFAMSWGAEAAEHDIPRALALITVALLAVLPEYAVDVVFAWKAGGDPSFAPYAAANMTGSNRLLLGLGWPAVSVLAWVSRRRRSLHLDRSSALPVVFLSVATLFSFTMPLRAEISPVDSLVLIALFAAYAVLAARSGLEEPDLVGPARAIGLLRPSRRRAAVVGLLAYSAGTIAVSAEPFADGLVRSGAKLGIDEFLLVQWLAPLASESPEFLVAALLALRGKANAALGLLLSSKINQWTLLVGSLPLAFSVGAGRIGALPLDERQVDELLLTAAQSLFGLAVLANLEFSLVEAALLAGLFLAQFVLGGVLRASFHETAAANAELRWFSVAYVVLAVAQLVRARGKLRALSGWGGGQTGRGHLRARARGLRRGRRGSSGRSRWAPKKR